MLVFGLLLLLTGCKAKLTPEEHAAWERYGTETCSCKDMACVDAHQRPTLAKSKHEYSDEDQALITKMTAMASKCRIDVLKAVSSSK
jgi:hypothetical protein